MKNLPLLVAAWLSLCLLGGCSNTVSVIKGSPRPNINMAGSQQTLALQLGPAVQDSWTQPGTNTMAGFKVVDWKATLGQGFKAGFSSSFPVVEGPAELALVLEEAELTFVPAAVAADGNTAAVRAQVRYKANLVDAAGAVLKRTAGTVESKRSTSARGESTAVAASAVESMFEALAKELWAANAPS